MKRRDLLKLFGIAAVAAPFAQSAEWLAAPAIGQETLNLDVAGKQRITLVNGCGSQRVFLNSMPLKVAINAITWASLDGDSRFQLLRVPSVVIEHSVSRGNCQLFLPFGCSILVSDHPLTLAVSQQLPSDWAVAIMHQQMSG